MQTVSISTLTSQKWAVVIDQCIQTRFHFLRSNVWHNNLENILDINTDIFYLRQKLVDMHAMISIAKPWPITLGVLMLMQFRPLQTCCSVLSPHDPILMCKRWGWTKVQVTYQYSCTQPKNKLHLYPRGSSGGFLEVPSGCFFIFLTVLQCGQAVRHPLSV